MDTLLPFLLIAGLHVVSAAPTRLESLLTNYYCSGAREVNVWFFTPEVKWVDASRGTARVGWMSGWPCNDAVVQWEDYSLLLGLAKNGGKASYDKAWRVKSRELHEVAKDSGVSHLKVDKFLASIQPITQDETRSAVAEWASDKLEVSEPTLDCMSIFDVIYIRIYFPQGFVGTGNFDMSDMNPKHLYVVQVGSFASEQEASYSDRVILWPSNWQ